MAAEPPTIPPPSTSEPTVQYSLFRGLVPEPIVNVASVPQRSLFRYPGGKTWLVPKIRAWMASLPQRPQRFLEPFAGGGIVGLTVAFERLADMVVLVERDADVAAVWRTVLGPNADALAERIRTFPFSAEAVDDALAAPAPTSLTRAFQTILRNRVNRGGILAPGSGRIKAGENGKGLASRWYPDTLARRIHAFRHIADRVIFHEGDGLAVMAAHAQDPSAVFFIDPPYTAAGKRAGSRLYRHSELDHAALFAQTAHLAGDFLMTYDDAEGVRALADRHGFATRLVPMKNTHHAAMTELLIGRRLDWV